VAVTDVRRIPEKDLPRFVATMGAVLGELPSVEGLVD